MKNFAVYWNNKKDGVVITSLKINDKEIDLNSLSRETLDYLSTIHLVPNEREGLEGYNPASMYSYKYMSSFISYTTMVKALDELKKLGHKRASWITMMKLRRLASLERKSYE